MKTNGRLVLILATLIATLPLGATWLPRSASAMTLNLELRERTGENSFARNVYLCDCSLDQYLAVPLPGPDWEKNTSATSQRYLMADETVNIAPAPPPGTPTSLDLIPEIPGADHQFIARVLGGTILGFGSQGVLARPQVARETTLTYYAGSVLHTVTDPSGTDFVLFSMDGASMATYDPSVLGGLAGLDLPSGWGYASEVLANELVVVTPGGMANLFGQGDVALWQELVVVPEPNTAILIFLGLAGLGKRGRPGEGF